MPAAYHFDNPSQIKQKYYEKIPTLITNAYIYF